MRLARFKLKINRLTGAIRTGIYGIGGVYRTRKVGDICPIGVGIRAVIVVV